MYAFVLIFAPFVIGLPVLAFLGRRFANRRKEEGAWDDKGPLHPTEPPVAFLKPLSSIADLKDLRDELERPSEE